MAGTPEQEIKEATDLADQALALIGRNKVGMWDSIQCLAMVSIAKSLAVIAARDQQR